MSLKLIKKFWEVGASQYWIQSAHRETALNYLIAGTGLVHKENLAIFPDDPLWEELEEIMPDWAIETLAQGAYVREYHIWEKETKEYFGKQLLFNGRVGNSAIVRPSKQENYVQAINRFLHEFSVTGLAEEMTEIEAMRSKVNTAKHDPGVLVEHFVSIDDFWAKHAAIASFWSKIADHECLIL